MAIDKFQQKLVKDLKSGKTHYEDAPIYTVLLELCQGDGVEEIFSILHNVASDLGKREELESKYSESIEWKW